MPKKHQLVPAVHLFLFNADRQLLMARRFNTGYEDGNYSVVAGHVEEHETVLEAARREAKEEVGIVIALEAFQFLHVMHRRREKLHLPDRVDFFVAAHEWQGELRNMEPNKCDELRWVNSDQLPANTVPYIREAIAAVQTEKPFTEYGW